ncbi:hypothetical protein ACFL42_05170, partial [Candidatus Omnitrophota bacterium]
NTLGRMFTTASDSVRQDAVDYAFYKYSNLMARVNQHLTGFTDKAGLTYEATREEIWRSWWMPSGDVKHLENYAYSDDEGLRNAYMGYEILDSLTKDLYLGDTELELKAQRMLTEIIGSNIGEYQYKEYGSDLYERDGTVHADQRDIFYDLSVVADDRYHEYSGTHDKKVKGELNDKWFLAGHLADDFVADANTAMGGARSNG